jgi:hypothetical protein
VAGPQPRRRAAAHDAPPGFERARPRRLLDEELELYAAVWRKLAWQGHRMLGHGRDDDNDSKEDKVVLMASFASDPQLLWKWGRRGRLSFWCPVTDVKARRLEETYPSFEGER